MKTDISNHNFPRTKGRGFFVWVDVDSGQYWAWNHKKKKWVKLKVNLYK